MRYHSREEVTIKYDLLPNTFHVLVIVILERTLSHFLYCLLCYPVRRAPVIVRHHILTALYVAT